MREAAIRLNKGIPQTAIEDALEKLFDRRQAMTLIAANREIYGLLRDGIPVEFDDAQGVRQQELSGCWISTRSKITATCRHDFYQGRARIAGRTCRSSSMASLFIELKNRMEKLRNAYDDNLTTYKTEIPQLFLTNAFCVLSNAIETKVGSITAEWEHFFNWLRADDEKQKIDRAAIREQGTSLEGVIEGLLPRHRLMHNVENFILCSRTFDDHRAEPQFLGVNRAYDVSSIARNWRASWVCSGTRRARARASR